MDAALEAKARAGDSTAQFQFAVALDRAGRRAEATSWMERAAESGHADALTLLAATDLQGLEKPRDLPRAQERLTRAVALGGNAARRRLAVLTAIGTFTPPDWTGAIALLLDAAKAGDWQALRELALLVEMASPRSSLAEELLVRAGLQGDGLAGFAIVRRQALHGRTLAPEHVFAQWRAGVAQIGHPLAASIANVIADPTATPKSPGPNTHWNAIAAVLATPPGLAAKQPTAITDKPFIRRFDNLLTVEECEYVIGLSARMLQPAAIVDGATGQGKQSGVRTNSVAVLWPVHQDMVIHALNLRLSAAAGIAPENGEMMNILMYRPGEEYRAHFDFFAPDIANADPSGQRIRTLLVYLSSDYDAGETDFITAGLKLKGNTGDAILFHNCDATGAPDRSSLHAGTPVTRGQKWLISKWYREKRFVP